MPAFTHAAFQPSQHQFTWFPFLWNTHGRTPVGLALEPRRCLALLTEQLGEPRVRSEWKGPRLPRFRRVAFEPDTPGLPLHLPPPE